MLSDSVDRYVSLHQAAGRVFSENARILAAYASFSEERGDTHVRIQTCLDWVHRFSSARQRRRSLLAVRRFALAMAAEDLRHEVPSPDLLPLAPYTRPQPYIFSPSQIAALIAAAEDCATVRCPVPGQYPTLFGLLAVTGLRIFEAIALDAGDITEDGLLGRFAKNRGRRLLPLHATTEAALSRHLQNRSRVTVDTDAVFLVSGAAAPAVLVRSQSRKREGSGGPVRLDSIARSVMAPPCQQTCRCGDGNGVGTTETVEQLLQ